MQTPRPGWHFLGYDHRREPVWSRERKHLLVCGPSQTGKTASLFAHAVINATGPTVAVTTKYDLLALRTPPGRTSCLLDLVGSAGLEGVRRYRFSPLSLVHTVEDALLTGRTLMDTAYSMTKSGVSSEAYWTQRGGRVTGALLWAAHRSNQPISQVTRWAAAQDAAAPLAALNEGDENDRVPHAILTGLTVADGRGGRKPSNQANAVWSFAEQAVALYAYPAAARLADRADLDPELFIRDRNQTLHIVCPSALAAELGPTVAVLIQALVDAQYRLTGRHAAETTDGQNGHMPRLTLILDEVANTAPLPLLPSICSEGAGQNVAALIGAQDRAQLEARFGEQQARSIVNNCRDRVITAELGDRSFLEDIETLSGRRLLTEETTMTRRTTAQDVEISETTAWGPRWRAWEMAQLGAGAAEGAYRALYLPAWQPQLINLVECDRGPSGLAPTPTERGWQ